MKKYLLFNFILLCIFLFVSCTEVGRSFHSFPEFIEYKESRDFIFLGKFNDSWPAKIVEIRTAKDEIEFKMKSGAKHRYPGYKGYELKMVRLISEGGKEAVIILRSKERKSPIL